MYFTVYKITNIINDKIYIGTHITVVPLDNYLGSGKNIKKAVAKYGQDKFKKEILFIFNDAESMFNKEKELVNEEFVVRSDTYNIAVGGSGGWDYINRNGLRANTAQHCNTNAMKLGKQKFLNDPIRISVWKTKLSLAITGKTSGKQNGMYGRQHSEESKKKMRNIKGKNQGPRNSQFDTCWITNGSKTLKIKKDVLVEWISKGYRQGRI